MFFHMSISKYSRPCCRTFVISSGKTSRNLPEIFRRPSVVTTMLATKHVASHVAVHVAAHVGPRPGQPNLLLGSLEPKMIHCKRRFNSGIIVSERLAVF